MGDDPIPQLKNQTPLEYAKKPNISKLLANSVLAFPSVLGKIAPESDAGVLANLGYDPTKYSTGRGWFEAIGLGLKPEEGDIALRTNFGIVENNKLKSVRVYLSEDELKSLEEEINDKVKISHDFEFKVGVGYRGALVIKKKGKNFSQYVSNNEPGYTVKFYRNGAKLSFASGIKSRVIKPIKAIRNSANYTAKILNDFIEKANYVIRNSQIYKDRKAKGLEAPNFIFVRDGAVRRPNMPDISSLTGKKWGAIVGMPLEKGIALSAGMQLIKDEELDDINKDFEYKLKQLINNFNKFNAFYIHIKQTDAASHLGHFSLKYNIIEKLDNIIIGGIINQIGLNKINTLVLTCDHRTSSVMKRHTNENIPVMIYNKKFGRSLPFGETNCKLNHVKEIKKATDIIKFISKL